MDVIGKAGLIAHTIVESIAASSFLLSPTKQLPGASKDAVALLRSYAACLTATIAIAIIFALRPWDSISSQVASALSMYHVGPLLRARGKLQDRDSGLRSSSHIVVESQPVGSPSMHLIIHGLLFLALFVPILG